MKIRMGTLRRLIREAALRGWGNNPPRSTERGKFVIATGKNRARAEAIAAELPLELKRGHDKMIATGDSHMAAVIDTNHTFFVEQDPGKGEWAVFLALDRIWGPRRSDWEVIRNTAARVKRNTPGR